MRLVAGILAAASVLAAAVVLQLYVTVTSRFEGRLWQLPSRIYSASLIVRPGDPLTAESLARRLDRSGYARADERPSRPGQYRPWDRGIELFVRPFAAASSPPPERPARVSFRGDRVARILGEQGRSLHRLELEPELLGTLYGARQEERQVLSLEQAPQGLIQAVLAAEDSRFFRHGGVDLRAVGRAALANVTSGRIVQGGSTITQQTVKNLFLDPRRSWWRKGRELLMSLLLDLRCSKERILEVYLNEIYLGQRGPVAICGVQAAARFYFGRDVADLSQAEWALLAGLIRSPGKYNPFVSSERALARRNQVLLAMQRLGYLDEANARRASAEKLELASGGGGFSRAAYAVDFVKAQLVELHPRRVLLEDGLSIYTTLDTTLQEQAEAALRSGLERLDRDAPQVRRQRDQRTLQGALVVLEPRTGAVLAMVGGRDYRESQFNRAVQARRQPGSCFKPFVYAAGFENSVLGRRGGLTAATVLDDSPIELAAGGKRWRPENYDGRFRGPVTVRQSLEDSLNVPTVRAARRVGMERIVELARRAGIASSLEALPSLALGSIEVTPLELASAYASLARQGSRIAPSIVREVRDAQGRPLSRRDARPAPAIDPRAAFLVTHLLQGVFERGTAKSAATLGFHGRAAGKTGTTDQTRDAWFVGYTTEVLALVWTGYDDNARTALTGASGALPIWVDFIKRAGLDRRTRHFRPPPGIVRLTVDPRSGRRAVAGCPGRISELFAEGTEPRARCRLHRPGLGRWLRRLGRRAEI